MLFYLFVRLFSELATLLAPLCITLLPCLLMGLPDLQTLSACETIHEPQTVKFEVQKCENYGTMYYLHTRLSPRWKRTLAKYSMTDILLTLVSNIYKAAPISLFMAPKRLNKLWEVGFQFPFILTGKSTMVFPTSQSWCISKSWYIGGAQMKDFGAVMQTAKAEFSLFLMQAS